jgi:hypothetical protein
MTHAALSPLIGLEFDQFLGAPIGEDRKGTTLSVLSACSPRRRSLAGGEDLGANAEGSGGCAIDRAD